MSDYLDGAKARASQQEFRWISDDWTQGFQYMEDLLSPIET